MRTKTIGAIAPGAGSQGDPGQEAGARYPRILLLLIGEALGLGAGVNATHHEMQHGGPTSSFRARRPGTLPLLLIGLLLTWGIGPAAADGLNIEIRDISDSYAIGGSNFCSGGDVLISYTLTDPPPRGTYSVHLVADDPRVRFQLDAYLLDLPDPGLMNQTQRLSTDFSDTDFSPTVTITYTSTLTQQVIASGQLQLTCYANGLQGFFLRDMAGDTTQDRDPLTAAAGEAIFGVMQEYGNGFLDNPGPRGYNSSNFKVALESSNPDALTVQPSVGSDTDKRALLAWAHPVPVPTDVTITGTLGKVTRSFTVRVTPDSTLQFHLEASATVRSDGGFVRWTPNPGLAEPWVPQFTVERSDDGGAYTAIATFPDTASSGEYLDTAARTTSRYRVRAVYNVNTWDADGASWESQYTLIGEPRALSVRVDQVRMTGPHTLSVAITGSFSLVPGAAKVLSFATAINGHSLSSQSVSVPAAAVGDQQREVAVDLQAAGVPRFTANQQFNVVAAATEGGQIAASSPTPAVILLPTVLVPGIRNGMGGPSALVGLQQGLKRLSIDFLGNRKGEGYVLMDGTHYPTIAVLSYNTDSATFAEGAQRLTLLVSALKSQTWADKVNLVAHSKGGLVSRQFVLSYPTLARQLIMACTPNCGAIGATVFSDRSHDYRNLDAVWPAYRTHVAQRFHPSKNRELWQLDVHRLPDLAPVGGFPAYTLIYSESRPTAASFTQFGTHIGGSWAPTIGIAAGDMIVPAFSVRGLLVNENAPTAQPTLIPAFAGVAMDPVSLPGPHYGYTDDPAVQAAVAQRLLRDLPDQ